MAQLVVQLLESETPLKTSVHTGACARQSASSSRFCDDADGEATSRSVAAAAAAAASKAYELQVRAQRLLIMEHPATALHAAAAFDRASPGSVSQRCTQLSRSLTPGSASTVSHMSSALQWRRAVAELLIRILSQRVMHALTSQRQCSDAAAHAF